MKYTIHGFSQQKATELELSNDDLLVLRWFIDFKETGSMDRKFIEDINNMGYWVSYSKVIDDLPILFQDKHGKPTSIKSKIMKLRRMFVGNLSKVLKRDCNRKGEGKGTKVFLSIVPEAYHMLVSNSEPPYKNVVSTPYKNVVSTPYKNVVSDSSIIDSSIDNNKYIYSRIIDYLNKKANSNYKSTTKKTQGLILARLNEGFSEDDFIKVIDNKCNDWLGTDYEQYLRPETLFGTKFESYLNQKGKKGNKYGNGNTSVRQDFNASENEYTGEVNLPEKLYTDDEVADI